MLKTNLKKVEEGLQLLLVTMPKVLGVSLSVYPDVVLIEVDKSLKLLECLTLNEFLNSGGTVRFNEAAFFAFRFLNQVCKLGPHSPTGYPEGSK
ncbi:MAG: hypothetical protein IIC78_06340 [Chloroflexi bacterium]|nr:hypothetical protein [Chloroflexota bacterium]